MNLRENANQPFKFLYLVLQSFMKARIRGVLAKYLKINQLKIIQTFVFFLRIAYSQLRWSETKQLKILIIDHFFSCQLMVMKLCTVIELRNIYPKLKSKFF